MVYENGFTDSVVELLEKIREQGYEQGKRDATPVVTCKECTNWHRCMSDDGMYEYYNHSFCLRGVNAGDGKDFYCKYGVRGD